MPDSVKNEPEEYLNEDDDMLAQQQQQQQQQSQHISSEDVKMDGFSSNAEDTSTEYMSGAGGGGGGGGGSGGGESNRTNTSMQQLQESYSSFLPGISVQSSASSSFLPHSSAVSSADHGRAHPSFLEGVQGNFSMYFTIYKLDYFYMLSSHIHESLLLDTSCKQLNKGTLMNQTLENIQKLAGVNFYI